MPWATCRFREIHFFSFFAGSLLGTSPGITRPSRPGPPQTTQWSCEPRKALCQKWSLCRIQDDQYFGHIVRGVWGVPCLENQALSRLQCLTEHKCCFAATPELPQSAANDMAANALAAQTSWVRSLGLSACPSRSPSHSSLPSSPSLPSVRQLLGLRHRCYEGHIITTEGGLCGPYAPGVC